MITINKNIFGKNFCFKINNIKGNNFLNEISMYRTIKNNNCHYEVLIQNFENNPFKDNIYSNNPSNFYLLKNGSFAVDYNTAIIWYNINSHPKKIIVYIKNFSFFRKFLSIEFRNNEENLSQIFHELVAVPLMFFEENRFPIHASAIATDKGAILFGGTGGVGKTSIELLLSTNKKAYFLADDICILDKEGYVYPNLAFPKIYGYNLADNKILNTKELLKYENIISKIHWYFHYYIRGPKKVRRKISPHILFKSRVKTEKVKLHKYFILFKTNDVKKITIEKINLYNTIKISQKIIENEYNIFFMAINWLYINSIILNSKMNIPSIPRKNVLEKALNNVNLSLIKIPIGYSHNEFLKEVNTILKEEIL